MAQEPWLMQVGKGLSAHFKQENGPSLPGVLWSVQLKQGSSLYTAMVKILFAANAPAEVRSNNEDQAKAAMHYLNGQLENGWHPSNTVEHTIIIGEPLLPAKMGSDSVKDYGWSFGFRCALSAMGLVFLGIAWGMRVSAQMHPEASPDYGVLAIQGFFALMGIMMLGYRMPLIVDSRARQVTQRVRLFGIPLKTRRWGFDEIHSVAVYFAASNDVEGALKRSTSLRLHLKTGTEPLMVKTFFMKEDINETAFAEGRQLAAAMGVPFIDKPIEIRI